MILKKGKRIEKIFSSILKKPKWIRSLVVIFVLFVAKKVLSHHEVHEEHEGYIFYSSFPS